MEYEELLKQAESEGLDVDEHYHFKGNLKGLYIDGNIALSDNLKLNKERSCILAEEIGHYHTTYGNITDQKDQKNIKQELRARAWTYERMVSLEGLISAYEARCKTIDEIAEYLDVTEVFAVKAIEHYRKTYGTYIQLNEYIIYFEPHLGILRLI